MRRFCFLLSFVVVNVLAVIDFDKLYGELVEQAQLTNRQIRRVSCRDVRLIPVIRKFVLADKSMSVLSQPNHDDEILQHAIDSEIELQTAITTRLGVPVPDQNRPIGRICTAMRNRCRPREPQNSEDIPFVDLKLQEERTKLFRDATKLFISSALRPAHEDYRNYNLMCRLKGVYRSILGPIGTYVMSAEVVDDECRLTDSLGKTTTVICIGDDTGDDYLTKNH
ncbi:uncharacterized protein LOC126845340 isoform X2 [Adelges cooleyi]|uniref:uncharacterized protein LOC126845340 isoform X2 n=1 Tax=Adelges cooleyi TaxID=133065 RepID=UPI00217F3D70|nr:uncharacterized protein LOC126845340 isoform X2 [Adelges cooleyi]